MSLSLDEHETGGLIVALQPEDRMDKVRALQDSIASPLSHINMIIFLI
jgi:hypothetical protein